MPDSTLPMLIEMKVVNRPEKNNSTMKTTLLTLCHLVFLVSLSTFNNTSAVGSNTH